MESRRRRARPPVIQWLHFMLVVVVAALEAALRVREQSVARGSSCWIPASAVTSLEAAAADNAGLPLVSQPPVWPLIGWWLCMASCHDHPHSGQTRWSLYRSGACLQDQHRARTLIVAIKILWGWERFVMGLDYVGCSSHFFPQHFFSFGIYPPGWCLFRVDTSAALFINHWHVLC